MIYYILLHNVQSAAKRFSQVARISLKKASPKLREFAPAAVVDRATKEKLFLELCTL